MIHVEYPGPPGHVAARQILARPAGDFFRDAISEVTSMAAVTSTSVASPIFKAGFISAAKRSPEPKSVSEATSARARGEDWTLELGPSLLFDSSGLRLLIAALERYRGPASDVRFRLDLDPCAYRDYYSLGSGTGGESRVVLPVTARRAARGEALSETLDVRFDYASALVDCPRSLAEPHEVSTPLALLMECHGEFDFLFANQVALLAALARDVPRSPRAWARALLGRRRGSLRRRLSLAYTLIHSDSDVHPTAVVEGSVIGAGARIGAHCVVRYSHIGERAQLFDGAKVEFSVVGPGSWLMQDLVLIRCHVEDEVFLIHGPYQFSSFHSGSAAFATILMDYRPDARPIKAMTFSGVREYRGRFLGAVLKEGAKSLGGSLLAPGIIIPADTWLACDLESIHKPGLTDLPQREPLPPGAESDRGGSSGRRRRSHPGGSYDVHRAISRDGRTRTGSALDGGRARRGMGG